MVVAQPSFRPTVRGQSTQPPKALGMPKPISSMRTITTFGAPSGARSMGCAGAAVVLASNGTGPIRLIRNRKNLASCLVGILGQIVPLFVNLQLGDVSLAIVGGFEEVKVLRV